MLQNTNFIVSILLLTLTLDAKISSHRNFQYLHAYTYTTMNAHTNKRDEIYTHRFERMSFTLIQRRNYNKKKEEET